MDHQSNITLQSQLARCDEKCVRHLSDSNSKGVFFCTHAPDVQYHIQPVKEFHV